MELSWTLLAVAVIAALGIGYFFGKGGRGNVVQVPAAPAQTPPAPARPLPPRPPRPVPATGPMPDWEVAARAEFAAGNKIMAIKMAREAMGLGLKEAKDLVESWE